MGRRSGSKTRNYPVNTLDQALVVIRAIADKGAGKPMDRLLVAQAIGRTPNSSAFKRLLSSSRQYGLTTGTEKADYITPTDLGLKITKPECSEDKVKGLVEACLKPDLFNRIYTQFNRNKLPEEDFLKNTLERSHDVDASLSEEVATLIIKNAKTCGILQDISGATYIRIDDPRLTDSDPLQEESISSDDTQSDKKDISTPDNEPRHEENASGKPDSSDSPRQLFVAHGKNREPLKDLKKILDGFKIPYKVAIDEPHRGRPIPEKVAELMRECSAGVFIFTRDEQFFCKKNGSDSEERWRPSENVVYELGAASILWERKIIILKEEGVTLPSDFSDLGYINFKNGEMASKALELLKELVGLELVRVEAT